MERKQANVYLRKDGKWEARYIKTITNDGQTIYGYCYGTSYQEAFQKMEMITKLLQEDMDIPQQEHVMLSDFACLCEEWLLLQRIKLKESTYAKYQNNIEKHILPFLGNIKVDQITTMKLQEFSSYLLNERKLSNKTVHDILTIFKSIWNYAVRTSPIPLQEIEIIYPRLHNKEMRVLSPEERQVLLKHIEKDMNPYKMGIYLSLMTGLRLGEVCALRWSDISFSAKLLTVHSTMQRIKNTNQTGGKKTKIVITEPKSQKSLRNIPLCDKVLQILENYSGVPDQGNLSMQSFVLTRSEQFFIEPRMMEYKFLQYTQECQIPDVHFHTLRHTFATQCVETGFEIKSLSEILGHSSPRITLERYVHSSLDLKRQQMSRMMEIIYT